MFGFGRPPVKPVSVPARKTFHGYAAATRYRPEWTPAFLAFKGGVAETKFASVTGGGQIYAHTYAYAPNVQVANAPGVVSLTGGGQIPYDPAYLQALLGGARGQGS